MKRSSTRPRRFGAPAFGALGLVILLALGWLLWARLTTPTVQDGSAPGHLETRQALVDLGTVPFEQVVEGQFELINTGQQTVRLLGKPQVRTLEGC